MNCGGGQSPYASGEIGALDFVLGIADSSRPFVLFDVGANDGEYLQAALHRIRSDLRAFSFEPQSASFDTLRVQFESDPRIHLRQVALGSEIGSAELFIGQGESTSSLHLSQASGRDAGKPCRSQP